MKDLKIDKAFLGKLLLMLFAILQVAVWLWH